MDDGFTLLHAVGSSHYGWPFSRMFSLIFSVWPSFDLVRALAFFLSVPVRTHTSAEWFIYGTTPQPPLFFLFQTYTFAFALFVSICVNTIRVFVVLEEFEFLECAAVFRKVLMTYKISWCFFNRPTYLHLQNTRAISWGYLLSRG